MFLSYIWQVIDKLFFSSYFSKALWAKFIVENIGGNSSMIYLSLRCFWEMQTRIIHQHHNFLQCRLTGVDEELVGNSRVVYIMNGSSEQCSQDFKISENSLVGRYSRIVVIMYSVSADFEIWLQFMKHFCFWMGTWLSHVSIYSRPVLVWRAAHV